MIPGPFKEGPVEISYEPSKEKQKVTIVIDFGETEIDALPAGQLMLDIVQLLRRQLNVKLSMYRD